MVSHTGKREVHANSRGSCRPARLQSTEKKQLNGCKESGSIQDVSWRRVCASGNPQGLIDLRAALTFAARRFSTRTFLTPAAPARAFKVRSFALGAMVVTRSAERRVDRCVWRGARGRSKPGKRRPSKEE